MYRCHVGRPIHSPRMLLRGDSVVRRREGLPTGVRVLCDEVPDSVVVREGPVRYEARLWTGQKTGGYLDQRENHLAAARYAKGRVLDVFSYVGGFSLHAARRVETVEAADVSGDALEAARANAKLNGLLKLPPTVSDLYGASQAADDGDYSPLLVGQGLRMLKDGQCAAEIVRDLVEEAGGVLSRLRD